MSLGLNQLAYYETHCSVNFVVNKLLKSADALSLKTKEEPLTGNRFGVDIVESQITLLGEFIIYCIKESGTLLNIIRRRNLDETL